MFSCSTSWTRHIPSMSFLKFLLVYCLKHRNTVIQMFRSLYSFSHDTWAYCFNYQNKSCCSVLISGELGEDSVTICSVLRTYSSIIIPPTWLILGCCSYRVASLWLFFKSLDDTPSSVCSGCSSRAFQVHWTVRRVYLLNTDKAPLYDKII